MADDVGKGGTAGYLVVMQTVKRNWNSLRTQGDSKALHQFDDCFYDKGSHRKSITATLPISLHLYECQHYGLVK